MLNNIKNYICALQNSKMRKVLVLIIITLFFFSCVPKKELVYFQGEPSVRDSIYKLHNEPYRLQVDDMLHIDIKSSDPSLVSLFKNTASERPSNNISQEILYFTSYSVDRHGNIRIPYLGDINVLGYTEREVTEKLQGEFEFFFRNKEDIFITVKLAGIRFTVLGEVNRPGPIMAFQNQINIVEAIASAGDIPITGNRKNIAIFRKSIDKTERFTVDLTDVNAFNNDNFYIKPNDVLYVEPLKQKSWGTGTTGAQTLTTIISILSLVTTTILLVKNF